MTLIASFGVNTGGVFLSDALLSSDSGRPGIGLSTIGKVHESIRILGNRRVYGTTRKTEIIGEHLILAWAGEYHAAHRIIEVIRSLANSAEGDTKFIELYLRANCGEELSKVSLLISGLGNNSSSVWANACREVIAPNMAIWFAGSGSTRFAQLLQSLPFASLSSESPVRQGIFCALSVAGALLAEEMRTAQTLTKGFGGHYDITLFDGMKPRVLDEITYIFWPVSRSREEIRINPPFKMQKPVRLPDGCVALYSLDLKAQGDGKASKHESYHVSTPCNLDNLRGRKDEDLRSDWQVNVFVSDLEDGSLVLPSYVSYCPNRAEHLVKFQHAGKPTGFTADPREIGRLLTDLAKK